MGYTLNRADGSVLTTVNDNTINSTYPVKFIGKSRLVYGETLNENLLMLLENFRGNSAPANPLQGQCWYDASVDQLKVCVNEVGPVWQSLDTVKTSAPASPVPGDTYFDTVLGQFFAYNGVSWILVGPSTNPTYVQQVAGAGTGSPFNSDISLSDASVSMIELTVVGIGTANRAINASFKVRASCYRNGGGALYSAIDGVYATNNTTSIEVQGMTDLAVAASFAVSGAVNGNNYRVTCTSSNPLVNWYVNGTVTKVS